ncbi:MAG: O-antigen ligase family protein, partial [Reyranellales bacterium]
AHFYGEAAEILGQAHAAVPSLAIDASRNVLLKCLTCGLIFAIARAISADQHRARWLLLALLASASVVVAYALLMQRSTHSCYVGGFLKLPGDFHIEADSCLMSGTFVNSNSFACFEGMAVVATVALLFSSRGARHESDEAFADEESVLSWLTGGRLVLIALALVFMGCLLMSGSRAVFATTVVSVVALVFLMMRGRWRSRSHLRRTIVAGILVASLVGVIAGGVLVQKMSRFGEVGNTNRTAIWRTVITAIGQSPWLGWGLGSFTDIYAVLQPVEIPAANDRAHSTPLETVLEMGIPAAVPTLSLVLLPWLVCLWGAWQRRRQRALPAAAFAIATVAILHSTVDFSLQIPAIGFWVSAVLGLGWAQTFGRREPSHRRFTDDP